MKQNSNLNHFQQLLFHTCPHLMNLIAKSETAAKTAPRVSKPGYTGGRTNMTRIILFYIGITIGKNI